MPVYRWSQTAASNAGGDPSINWSEGQAPSSINDSARATMAAVAQWRDDISGATVTTGTSAAYALSTFSNFTSAALMANQVVSFTPHVTNAAGPVTITIDSIANVPLRTSPGKELPAGVLIQGTPYVALYNNTDGTLYLQGFYGNPYSVPIGGMIDYTGTTAPNSSFVLPFGQAISRTTYATYFALVGTTYGAGDGATTFNIPDLRGRFVAGADNMGGSAASRLTSTYLGASPTLGASGGAQSHTLTAGEIPVITSAVSTSGTLTGSTSSVDIGITPSATGGGSFGFNGVTAQGAASVTVSGSMSGSATSNNAGGNAHSIVPPTIVLNKILRII